MNLRTSKLCLLHFKRSYRYNLHYILQSLLSKTIICFFVIQSYVTCDDVDNVTMIEPEIKYNTDFSLYNDSNENLTASIINISYVDIYNNTVVNESDFDVATELESSISVTEDSDNSIQTFWEYSIFLTPDKDICNCDLSFSVCDINCCCDPDCSDEDKQVFSECFHQVLIPDENYCYQNDIILRNNTVYKIVKDPKSGMFCIMYDNFKHHLRFKDMPILRSHRDLNTVLKYKYQTTYSWESENEETFETNDIKAGNPIYVDTLSENISNRWSLPSSCLSNLCSCYEGINYLIDFKSSCSYVIKDLHKECEKNKILSGEEFLNFCINPRSAPGYLHNNIADLILHTKIVGTNASVNDEYSSSQICVNSNIIRPKKSYNVCKNIVRSINFIIEQDGINGITKINADFKYTNINIKEINVIIQTYTVNFIWGNNSHVERKSGNPGYHIGFPVLVAINGSAVDSEEMTMKLSNLNILDKDFNSFCSHSRQIIKFGKNLKSGCYLQNNFKNCKMMQDEISDILLGPNKKVIFVGIFGNANVSNINDWIEVFYEGSETLENNNKCFASLDLKINVIYASVGTIANPQHKIVGVAYHHVKPEFIDLSCFPACKNILLTTSVSFFDVTLPAVLHYAKVPSIKANLPSDFFYPFLYSQSIKMIGNLYFVLFLYILTSNVI